MRDPGPPETGSRRAILLTGTLSAVAMGTGLWLLWRAAGGSPAPSLGIDLSLFGLLGMLLSMIAAFQARLTARDPPLQPQQDNAYMLHAIWTSTRDVLFVKDLEGRYLAMNPAGVALLGKPLNELLGKRDRDLFDPEQARVNRAHDQATLDAGKPLMFEDRVVLADGIEHVFSSARYPFYASDGSLAGVIGIAHDITERLQGESARARLAAIVTASPHAIFSVAPESRTIQMWNPAAEQLFGYTAAEALGKPIRLLVPPELLQESRERFSRALAGEAVPPYETVRIHKDGRRIDVWVSMFAIRDDQGRIVNVSAIVRDLTDLRSMQQQVAHRTAELQKAQEINALKDHFLSTLSHEIKTPLSLICGYTELLEEKYPGEELLDGLVEGSQRLNAHITDLLEYSALISGTLRLHMTDVNLEEIGRHVSHVMAPRLRQHGLDLTLEVEPGTPLVHGDYRRLSEMILKLLENSEKFTPAGGKVGVRIGHTDGRVRIDVWDTGPGIPEHDFARIWEAFTQLATSDTTRKGGLGLGLSLVKKLAELHAGRVGVVSQPGKGTTFSLTLPASVPARPPGSVNTP